MIGSDDFEAAAVQTVLVGVKALVSVHIIVG